MVQYFEHSHAPMQIVHLGVSLQTESHQTFEKLSIQFACIQGIINTNIRTLKALHSNRKQNNPNPVAKG